ncbi:phage integrase Arm DNA-binding domain-containing protein [Mycobacteroides chelonae]|jgi:hypothetical protein|nr:phage integrase Arm DNA-binding domain-containing protein [Mycobacteroides chelonae]
MVKSKPRQYNVYWHWRDPVMGETPMHHLGVSATNAERALNKVKAEVIREHAVTRRDIVIDEVVLAL